MNAAEAVQQEKARGPTLDVNNPWPGLLPYRESDSEFFHGREDESDELFRSVLRKPLSILFSRSGFGKTSLLQAGLFPQLRNENIFPVYVRLVFSLDVPDFESQIKRFIKEKAGEANIEYPPFFEDETLWEYFHRRDADFWNEQNRPQLPILVFDQFEEVFTLGRSDERVKAASDEFLAALGDLIEGRPPDSLKTRIEVHPDIAKRYDFTRHFYKILISLREDYLADLEELRENIPSIVHNRIRLSRMNGVAAKRVVAYASHLISDEVAEDVVRLVSASDSPQQPLDSLVLEPALLSVVCREFNIKREENGAEKITSDLVKGSRDEILTAFYERSTAALTPNVRKFIEDKLITVSGHRDSIALENAESEGITSHDIDLMTKLRLVRVEKRGGMERLELTHDLLTEVIASSRDKRRQLELELDQEKARRRRVYFVYTPILLIFLASAALLFFYAQGKISEAQSETNTLEKENKTLVQEKKELVEEAKNPYNPIVRIKNGRFYSDSIIWKDALQEHKATIIKNAASVGRIRYIRGSSVTNNATGFVIGSNIILIPKNRDLMRRIQPRDAYIDFRDTFLPDSVSAANKYGFFIKRVVAEDGQTMIAEVDTMNQDGGKLPPKLEFVTTKPTGKSEEIYLIGYPTITNRDTTAVSEDFLNQQLAGVLNVKRVQPGKILDTEISEFFNREVFKHDSFTMGGNLGSPVVRFSDGKVIGQHVGGKPYTDEDWASGIFKEAVPLTAADIEKLLRKTN